MKRRMGFVSNSSTSSFCIFGAWFEKISEITKVEDKDDEGSDFEDCYTRCEKLGLAFVDCQEYEQGYYIGLPWSSIKNDETGAEFKKRARNAVKKLTGKNTKCETHEGTYPS